MKRAARADDQKVRVALLTTFKANRKDQLAGELERIYRTFIAGPGAPSIRFVMADAPVAGFTSSVDRVLKRFPELKRFLSDSSMLPSLPAVRHLSNGPTCSVPGEQADFATLLAIAAGVPRSFPLHNISIHFQHRAFGDGEGVPGTMGSVSPGVMLSDSWWVNGRNRSVMAYTIVDGDVTSKELPELPEAIALVLAACGKVKSTVQTPFTIGQTSILASPVPEAAQTANQIVRDYKAKLTEIVERANLPHDLPPAAEVIRSSLGMTSGPKKPTLVNAFEPMGYDCKGESGTFTLRRRTQSNITVEINLDVGTWSNNLTALFEVQGLGFRGILPLPVCKRAMGALQYPIGDAERWQKLVDNMAALVAELDRTLVPELERAIGPSPEWYKPDS